mmetsp:Transcript_13433/g.31584  ORF Transcript_13433/g.31584 Transcript_13433/m.31584 type:complete len:897 (+) Transcript_13433:135-2825(+)
MSSPLNHLNYASGHKEFLSGRSAGPFGSPSIGATMSGGVRFESKEMAPTYSKNSTGGLGAGPAVAGTKSMGSRFASAKNEEVSKRTLDEIVKRTRDGAPPGIGKRSATVDIFAIEKAKEAGCLKRFVVSKKFDVASAAVIVANALILGLEQEFGDKHGIISALEHIFLVCYILELLCRVYAHKWRVVKKSWWWFDLCLVIVSIFAGWILPPLLSNSDEDSLQVLMVLRSTRLLRLARIFQVSRKLRVLGLLVKGLLTSMKTIFYTLLLLFMVLYMASCISMEIITNHRLAKGDKADPVFQEHVQANFNSLHQTMLTLTQFVTLDNMNLIYKPLIDQDWKLAGFFMIVILLVSIVLTNLITGVIVNSAMEAAVEDREQMRQMEQLARKKEVMQELRDVFERIDIDGNGSLSWYEIESAQNEDRDYLGELLTTEDPMEIFTALDTDKTGEVDIGEFCDIVWQIAISGKNVEMRRMEKSMGIMQDHLKDIEQANEDMRCHIESLHKMVYTQTEHLARTSGLGFAPGPAPGLNWDRMETPGKEFGTAAALNKVERERERRVDVLSSGHSSGGSDEDEDATLRSLTAMSYWGGPSAKDLLAGPTLSAGSGSVPKRETSQPGSERSQSGEEKMPPPWALTIMDELQLLRREVHWVQVYAVTRAKSSGPINSPQHRPYDLNKRPSAELQQLVRKTHKPGFATGRGGSNGSLASDRLSDEVHCRKSHSGLKTTITGHPSSDGVVEESPRALRTSQRPRKKTIFNLDEGVESSPLRQDHKQSQGPSVAAGSTKRAQNSPSSGEPKALHGAGGGAPKVQSGAYTSASTTLRGESQSNPPTSFEYTRDHSEEERPPVEPYGSSESASLSLPPDQPNLTKLVEVDFVLSSHAGTATPPKRVQHGHQCI